MRRVVSSGVRGACGLIDPSISAACDSDVDDQSGVFTNKIKAVC